MFRYELQRLSDGRITNMREIDADVSSGWTAAQIKKLNPRGIADEFTLPRDEVHDEDANGKELRDVGGVIHVVFPATYLVIKTDISAEQQAETDRQNQRAALKANFSKAVIDAEIDGVNVANPLELKALLKKMSDAIREL